MIVLMSLRYISSNAMNIALGRYPFGPHLLFLSESTIASMYEKSFLSKTSRAGNDSSLTGLSFFSSPSLASQSRSLFEPITSAPPSDGFVLTQLNPEDGAYPIELHWLDR